MLAVPRQLFAACANSGPANPGPVNNLIVRDNEIVDCGNTDDDLTTYQTNGIHIAAIARPVLTGNVIRRSGYDGNPNGTSAQIYLRSVDRPVLKGGNIFGGMGRRGILTTHCTAPEISDVMLEKNAYQGIAVHESDGTVCVAIVCSTMCRSLPMRSSIYWCSPVTPPSPKATRSRAITDPRGRGSKSPVK